jgi:hypothetical protein
MRTGVNAGSAWSAHGLGVSTFGAAKYTAMSDQAAAAFE